MDEKTCYKWKKDNFQEPTIESISFVDEMFVWQLSDFIIGLLNKGKAGPKVAELFNQLCFWNMFEREYYKHDGKVPEDLNEVVAEEMIETINLMHQFGQTW